MANRRRQDQLGEQIAEDLSELIRTRVKDPRVGFASITSVELSADLRHAKVYVSVYGEATEQKATMRALDHATGFLRHELAQRLTIRYTPEISFHLDESIARGAHLLDLMRQMRGEQAPAPSGTEGPTGEASPLTGSRPAGPGSH
jgi:ribosome-binding factor A